LLLEPPRALAIKAEARAVVSGSEGAATQKHRAGVIVEASDFAKASGALSRPSDD